MSNIPTYPEKSESMVFGRHPWVWWGTADRVGTATTFADAPCGSQYTYANAGTAAILYAKITDDGDDDDWVSVVD